MIDIVERLRKWATPIPGIDESMTGDMMLMADAADEIDRLRAALREIAGLGVIIASDMAIIALREARAALEERT